MLSAFLKVIPGNLRLLARSVMACFLILPVTAVQGQPTKVDHSLYDALLARYVTDGLVDYDAFAADPAFDAYLAEMERVDPLALAGDERVAFWINMYNAWTIKLVNQHHERASIRNINKTLGIFRLKGPWTVPIARSQGRLLSLDEIQFGKLRAESKDPRIHFALSCGAMSCAPLRSEAYIGDRLDAQLHDQGNEFLVNSDRYNRFDTSSRTFYRNAVFRYFAEDFGESRIELGQFLAIWYSDTTPVELPRMFSPMGRRGGGPPSDSSYTRTSQVRILQTGAFRTVDMPFDWTLNIRRAQ